LQGAAHRTTQFPDRQEPLTAKTILPILDRLIRIKTIPTVYIFGGDLWLKKQKLRKSRMRCERNVLALFVVVTAKWFNLLALDK
jgi:hypothetical protein